MDKEIIAMGNCIALVVRARAEHFNCMSIMYGLPKVGFNVSLTETNRIHNETRYFDNISIVQTG
jgi:hypothetical protein